MFHEDARKYDIKGSENMHKSKENKHTKINSNNTHITLCI